MKKLTNYLKLTFVVFIFLSKSVSADGIIERCSKSEAKEIELIADSLRSWQELYVAFKKYNSCDDGAIAEGFSESISLLMSEKWESIDQLHVYARKDSKFQKFVIKHLDETAPMERLKKIKMNAISNCGKNIKGICSDILSTAVIKELK